MTILYSESNNTCYDTNQNYSSYPDDCVEITQEQFETYFLNNAPSGQERSYDSETNTFSWVDITYTAEEIMSQCKADLSAKRWDMESIGVTIDSIAIQTDMESKNEMAGYVTDSIFNGLTEVHWKLADGTFNTYLIVDFKNVYKIVAEYRNDCFGIEKSKAEEMDLAADPTTVDIETGWPDTTFTTS